MAIGKRREFEVFTLSFLDCICCGFGAIILLLVLTDVGQPIVIERSEKDLKGQIDALQRQLFDLRGETEILNRELQGRVKEKDAEQQKAAILAGDLSKIRGEFKASIGDAAVANKVEQELVAVYQTLTAEQQFRALSPSQQTTFDGVTHALMRSALTHQEGRALGHAIDLLSGVVVESIEGQLDGADVPGCLGARLLQCLAVHRQGLRKSSRRGEEPLLEEQRHEVVDLLTGRPLCRPAPYRDVSRQRRVALALVRGVGDFEGADLPGREARPSVGAGWQLRLEPPDHHLPERLVGGLHATREPLRVEELEECRERLRVAVVRRGREEKPVLEVRG